MLRCSGVRQGLGAGGAAGRSTPLINSSKTKNLRAFFRTRPTCAPASSVRLSPMPTSDTRRLALAAQQGQLDGVRGARDPKAGPASAMSSGGVGLCVHRRPVRPRPSSGYCGAGGWRCSTSSRRESYRENRHLRVLVTPLGARARARLGSLVADANIRCEVLSLAAQHGELVSVRDARGPKTGSASAMSSGLECLRVRRCGGTGKASSARAAAAARR
jgi:hypothetical protein